VYPASETPHGVSGRGVTAGTRALHALGPRAHAVGGRLRATGRWLLVGNRSLVAGNLVLLGFLFARPLTAAQLEEMLAEGLVLAAASQKRYDT
jgi:hypothetical protein